VSYTAPIWAAAALTLVATVMALVWLPETVHRAHAGVGNPFGYLPELLERTRVRRVLLMDFVYWCSFAVFQTTFALFAARRFGFDVAETGYFFAGFGILGAIIQGGMIRHVVRRFGDKSTFMLGVTFGAIGLAAVAVTHTVAAFTLGLVPVALGIGFGHPTMSSLVSLVGSEDEQGRVQGAASAVESFGRTVGPVWGNASLQQFGETVPYVSAAALLIVTLVLAIGLNVSGAEAAPVSRAS
jgi:DHA1 family tetracycline resistance protein-like MFS transporter